MQNLNDKLTKLLVFVFGVVFIVWMIDLAARFPEPTDFQYFVFRVILSLAAAGVAALVPGLLDLRMGIKTENYVRAGSALAVFVLVYMQSPASLVKNPISQNLFSQELPDLRAKSETTRENFSLQQGVNDSHEIQELPPGTSKKDRNSRVIEKERECMYKMDVDGKLVLHERISEDVWIPVEDCEIIDLK